MNWNFDKYKIRYSAVLRNMQRNFSIEEDFLRLPERAFRQRYKSYNIRCGILLFRASDCKFLLVKEKPRLNFKGEIFGPPKGTLEVADSSFLSAALRELREETAIVLLAEEGRIPTRFVAYHHYFREILILFMYVITSAEMLNVVPNQREISECVWVTSDEAKKLPSAKCTNHILLALGGLLGS